MKRKILSLILAFAMTVSLLTVGTGAVEPTYGDTAGHWAESSIERWSGHGIIQGSNGKFDPNGQLTCAQLATILAKLLKLPAAKDAGFTDNTADAWYYDAINRCAAAGILNGNGDGTVTPEAPITRERAMVMLARALGIEPIRKPDLTKYTDAAQVSAYAQGYVAALIEAGIVGGVTADQLAPQNNITRAATVTILDRAISTYADKAGATVKADGKGIVLVVAENVKITGAPEGTKIVVADGATGLTVNGKSVSDDQTYIVPKTTTGSGSSSSGGSSTPSHTHSYDATTHKCSCGEVDPAYAVASVSSKNYLTLSEAITAAQSGNKTVTLAASKTTTETIQQILDGQHGSIDGLTIELPSGTYGALELGRATKYVGSNTKYYLGRNGINTEKTLDEIKAWSDSNEWGSAVYVRSMSNVTLKAADGASVKIAGVNASSGHKHVPEGGTPIYDYVLDKETTVGSSHYLVNKLSNITFDGLTFTAGVDINTSNEETIINGVAFRNCVFDINNKESGHEAIHFYNENNNGKVCNLIVENCEFNNCYQGIYTQQIKNISITNNKFSNTGHNAIAIQSGGPEDNPYTVNHGAVIIDHNTFKSIGDRIIRFNKVGADTQITITHNTADNNSGKKAENTETREVIKAESLAGGVTCNIHSNSWGDGATFGTGFTEETGEPCAEINGVKYISLAKALAAAKSGDIVKLVSNISTNTTIAVTGDKAITIDFGTYTLTGASGVQVLHVGGTANVTLTATTGGINGGSGGNNVAIIAKEKATINITSGNYTVGGDANGSGNSTVYVVDNGKVNISGGTFSSEKTYQDKYYVLNLYNSATGSISVTGGTFVGQNPGDGDDNKGGTFLAPGYTVDNKDGAYTVREMTWNEYPEDGSMMPSGVGIDVKEVTDSEGKKHAYATVTLKDEDAFKYFTQIFDMDAACRARETALDNGATHYPGESVHNNYNIWYRAYGQVHVEMAKSVDLGGMEVTPFTEYSTFDGKGFTISNANVSDNDTSVGFFGGYPVSNVKMDRISVTANGAQYAGVISGFNSSSITNVTVTNSTVTGGRNTGAIVGNCYVDLSGCTIENCTVSGQYKVGGLAGYVCREDGQKRIISNNTLRNVTLKGENRISGKSDYVIGQAIGNWNARSGGSINGTTIENVTGADSLIGKIESDVATPSIDGKVQVGSQEALANAISSTTAGEETSIKLAAGTYTLPGDKLGSKTISITGTENTVIDLSTGTAAHDASITMDGVTVKGQTEGNFQGLQHTKKVIYKNCTITGKQTLYANDVEFIKCKFNSGTDYALWTYGAKNVTFTQCEFESGDNSKAVLCYSVLKDQTFTRTFNKCTFTATGTADKSAIMINPTESGGGTNTYIVNINDCTATGYAENGISDQTIVGLRNKGAGAIDNITISINDIEVYKTPTTTP